MATLNPLLTVSHADWMNRTKVSGLARRPGTLKKIDDLYKQAYDLLRTPNSRDKYVNTLRDMLPLFESYLQERGAKRDWTDRENKDLHRNRLSGGLMKQMHYFLLEFVGPQKTVPLQDSRHTRAGVLYLLGHTQPSINMWSVASAAVTVGTATASLGTTAAGKAWESQNVGKLKVADPVGKMNTGMQLGLQIGEKTTGGGATHPSVGLYDRVLAMVKGLAERIQKYFQIRDGSFYSNLGKVLRVAADYVVGILTKAAPIVGAALDIGQGFVKACSAVINYLGTRRERSRFLFVPGHPALLARGIEDAMKFDITAGLIQICKGALSAAFGALTAGIASLITEVVLTVVNFLRRFFEKSRIEEFCYKAAVKLTDLRERGYNLGSAEENKGKFFTRLVDDVDEFRDFYQEGVNASVSIPILTLNSGICGDLMQMIQMYDARSAVISQESFDAAARYFQRLKLWGAQHIQKNGINFSSNYRNVGNLLHHAVYGHQGLQSTRQQVVSVLAA